MSWIIRDLKDVLNTNMPTPLISGQFFDSYLLDNFATQGGVNNPFTMDLEAVPVLLIVKVNGIFFGRFLTLGGVGRGTPQCYPTYNYGAGDITSNHAEDGFLSAWHYAKAQGALEALRLDKPRKPFYITFKASKTPCVDCGAKLVGFVQHAAGTAYEVQLREKAAALYSGLPGPIKNTQMVVTMLNAGIPVTLWDLPYAVTKHRKKAVQGDHPRTKNGLIHETVNLNVLGTDSTDLAHRAFELELRNRAATLLERLGQHTDKDGDPLSSPVLTYHYVQASRNK
jgi:hypothetical protein